MERYKAKLEAGETEEYVAPALEVSKEEVREEYSAPVFEVPSYAAEEPKEESKEEPKEEPKDES